MCGIIGIHFKNPKDTGVKHERLERFVNELLLGIEPRGKDATGLLTVDAKGVPTLVKADARAETFIAWRQPIPRRVRTILGHTRFATQGLPSNLDNDHPVQYGTCFAIHNGHISNDSELFGKHSLERHAEVDSEIIPALFDKFGLDKAHLALQEFEGNMATAVVDPERFPGVTVLAKGWSSPVIWWENKHGVVWASTEEALVGACEKALGFKPSREKLKTLSVGDILYMDGDKIETLSFRAAAGYTRKSNPNYGTGYSSYSSGGTSYNPSTGAQSMAAGFLYDECKSCGCERMYHGSGGNFQGACHNEIPLTMNAGVFICRCEKFVFGKVGKTNKTGIEYCDGCGRQFPVGQLKAVGLYFFCPTTCARELFKEGPTSEQLRKSAEEIVTAQIIAAETADGDEFCNDAWQAREDGIHDAAVTFASDLVGLTPAYINWILFRAPIELFDADKSGYLNKTRELAEGAYKDMEAKVRSEVIDLDIARWEAGDMKLNKGCEGCGGVVQGEGMSFCEDCNAAESCGVVIYDERLAAFDMEVGL